MTREEAIKELKEDIELYIPLHGTIDDVDRDLPDGRLITALEMGIKAIEQEPCLDAISRQAAIDAVIDLCKYYTPTKSVNHPHMDFVIEALQDLPSVNPQPKTGRWIEHPEIETSTPEYLMFYECSECGDKQCFCKLDIHKKHFCNNCGAKMVEPQESEDKNEFRRLYIL